MFSEEQKLFFEAKINNLINKIIEEKINKSINTEKQRFKNVVLILEEAKINLLNDKKFDINKAVSIYTKINYSTPHDKICSSLIDLALDIQRINK